MSARASLSFVALLGLAPGVLPACSSSPAWRAADGSRPSRERTDGASGAAGASDEGGPEVRLFRPGEEPAPRYNDAVPPAPRSELAETLLALVARAATGARKAVPVADARLYAVASEIAELAGAEGPIPYSAVEFALSHRGIIEPSPHLIVVRAAESDSDAVAQDLAARLPAIVANGRFSRVGIGRAPAGEGLTTIVLALQESFIETDPIPRATARGKPVRIRGKLRGPFDEPRLYVTRPDGKVQTPPMAREGAKGFRVEVGCDGDGRRQVEITGRDARGSSVLANFPVWCGEVPPRTFSLPVVPPDEPLVTDARAAEHQILTLLNQARRTAGLAPLTWDDRAAEVARAHSREMRDEGFVGHVSPTTGSAADRVARAKIATPLVLENLARAYSAREAHLGLMNSPGHRANLLSDEATRVGIGVVFGEVVSGRPELYVTQVFLRIPPRLDPQAARKAARRAIASRRESAGAPALTIDGDLDRAAHEHAAALAAAENAGAAAARTDETLDTLASRYSSVLTVSSIAGDPREAASDAVLDPSMRAYGLGLAQGGGRGEA